MSDQMDTLNQFRQWLQDADRDRDGTVTRDEVIAFEQEYPWIGFDGGELVTAVTFFDQLDTDKNGVVDEAEFLAAYDKEYDRIEAATPRVSKLTPPYPTQKIRIHSARSGTTLGENYDGVIQNVVHEGDDLYTVTLYRGETIQARVYGRDIVGEPNRRFGQANAGVDASGQPIKKTDA